LAPGPGDPRGPEGPGLPTGPWVPLRPGGPLGGTILVMFITWEGKITLVCLDFFHLMMDCEGTR